MIRRKTEKPKLERGRNPRKALHIGFLPENDCAPIVLAQEFGLFKRYGLEVELHGLASWKQVQDRVAQGQLDAAAAPGMLPFLMQLGLTPEKCDCVSGMVLSLQGNAITVSRELWRLGVRDAATLREQIWQDRHRKTYAFGVAAPLCSQYALFCNWLRAPVNPPYTQVRIESVPPDQMFPLLKLGYLDGFCSAEPWNTVAVHAGLGACIATSATLAPLHPEKVLIVRNEFARARADEHERLIAALLEACYLCDQPENRALLCQLLAQPKYVNAPAECLEPGLVGPFGPNENPVSSLNGLNIFHRCRANEPSAAKSAWLTGRLFDFLRWNTRPKGLDGVLRRDIFERAQRLAPEACRANGRLVEETPSKRPEGSMAVA